jgi:hypothetical protein
MMVRFISFIAMAFLLASPLFASEFTADSRIVTPGKTVESRFIFVPDRWRIEEKLPQGDLQVTIFRQDKKGLFVLWPGKRRYIIQPLDEKQLEIISTRKPGEELERTELGQETVSGFATTKYRVKYNVREKKAERTVTSIEWFSKKLGIVIKSQAEDGSWSMEIANIKEGALDRRLFEVPSDYQKLSFKDVFKKTSP